MMMCLVCLSCSSELVVKCCIMHPFDCDKAIPKGAPNKRREKLLLLQINFGKTIELNTGDACGCTEAEWERTVSKRASVCRVRVPTFKRCSHKTVLYVVLVFFCFWFTPSLVFFETRRELPRRDFIYVYVPPNGKPEWCCWCIVFMIILQLFSVRSYFAPRIMFCAHGMLTRDKDFLFVC